MPNCPLIVSSDASGAYRIVGVSPGSRLGVVAWKGDQLVRQWYPGRDNASQANDIALEPGDTIDNVDFALSRAAFMTVPVTGADSGDPLPGAIVLLVSSTDSFERHYALRSKEGPGRMRLGPVHPGSYTLSVMPGASNPGYSAVDRATSPGIAPEGIIELGPEDDVEFAVELAPVGGSGTEAGAVGARPSRTVAPGVAPPGAHLQPGATTHVMPIRGSARTGWPGFAGGFLATSDRGVLAVLTAAPVHRVRLALLGPALAILLVVGPGVTASGTEPTGRLSGTVTGDGTALANVWVTVTPVDPRGVSHRTGPAHGHRRLRALHVPGAPRGSREGAGEGPPPRGARRHLLAAGVHVRRRRASSRSRRPSVTANVDLPVGGSAQGQVVDAGTGAPVEGARVTATHATDGDAAVASDTVGAARADRGTRPVLADRAPACSACELSVSLPPGQHLPGPHRGRLLRRLWASLDGADEHHGRDHRPAPGRRRSPEPSSTTRRPGWRCRRQARRLSAGSCPPHATTDARGEVPAQQPSHPANRSGRGRACQASELLGPWYPSRETSARVTDLAVGEGEVLDSVDLTLTRPAFVSLDVRGADLAEPVRAIVTAHDQRPDLQPVLHRPGHRGDRGARGESGDVADPRGRTAPGGLDPPDRGPGPPRQVLPGSPPRSRRRRIPADSLGDGFRDPLGPHDPPGTGRGEQLRRVAGPRGRGHRRVRRATGGRSPGWMARARAGLPLADRVDRPPAMTRPVDLAYPLGVP